MKRFVAAVAIASMASGCTLVGNGVGGAIPKPQLDARRAAGEPPEDFSAEGTLVGVVVDAALLVLVLTFMSSSHKELGSWY